METKDSASQEFDVATGSRGESINLIFNHVKQNIMKELNADEYKEIFNKAAEASTVQDLENLINEHDFIKKALADFKRKYPLIDLSISLSEIEELKVKNLLNKEHLLDLSDPEKFSAFERLLLSVLWKNGHTSRIKPIADGIAGKKDDSLKYGFVFRQFGRSLADPDEPIIDQHVLRAFHKFYYEQRCMEASAFPTKRAINDSDKNLIEGYVDWF